jgi:hypothetical protein
VELQRRPHFSLAIISVTVQIWVISVYFNTRNTLPKSGTFLLGHPVYICVCVCVRVCLCMHMHPQNVPSYQRYSVKIVAFRGPATYPVSSSYVWTVGAESSKVRRCHLSWKTIRSFSIYYVLKDIQIHFQWQRNFSEIVINHFTVYVSRECMCCWTLSLSGSCVYVFHTAVWYTVITCIMVTVYRRFRVTYCLLFRRFSFYSENGDSSSLSNLCVPDKRPDFESRASPFSNIKI